MRDRSRARPDAGPSKRRTCQCRQRNGLLAGTSKDGSDGTRTRDLRRDRPLQRSQRAQQCTRERTVHAVLWWPPARLRMATRRGSRRLLPICCPLDVSMLEAEVGRDDVGG